MFSHFYLREVFFVSSIDLKVFFFCFQIGEMFYHIICIDMVDGISPVWILMCLFRLLALENIL